MAAVMIKATRKYLARVHTNPYCDPDENGDPHRDGNGRLVPIAGVMINPDVSAVIDANGNPIVDPMYWDFDDDNNAVVVKSQADKDTADVDNVNLAPARTVAYDAIDLKTRQLIAAGHVFNAKTFSLSENAYKKLITWRIKADNGDDTARTEPTIDSTEILVLADAAEVITFTDSAFAAIQAHIDSGEALRAPVMWSIGGEVYVVAQFQIVRQVFNIRVVRASFQQQNRAVMVF